MQAKVIALADINATLAPHRARGARIVLCHGTFDLVHPGHIVHLEEAKALGDLLVVSVTADAFVRKGPGRPYFNDALRAQSLAALSAVDYVVIIPHPGVREAMLQVRPAIYCKGEEYRNPQQRPPGSLDEDILAAREVGARVEFVGSFVSSSTRLLNTGLSPYDAGVRVFCETLAQSCPPDAFAEIVESFRTLRVLVVGDIIFDRYTQVAIQGLTSKTPVMSTRFVHQDVHGGGALACFRHIREFCPDAALVGLVGREPWVHAVLRNYAVQDQPGILAIDGLTSIVKERFIEPVVEGKEVRPLFAVASLDTTPPPPAVHAQLLEHLSRIVADYDLVIAMDFGHGAMSEPVRDLLQQKARFLAVNCQTNSANFGFNVLTHRYRRADSFSLDRTELHLAAGARRRSYREDLEHLSTSLGARYAWFTRGPEETIGLKSEVGPALRAGRPAVESCHLPPFEHRIIDATGAGDAFCALASLAAVRNLSLPLATFLGQLAGATAVRWVGNAEAIQKSTLIRGAQTMLRT